MSSLKTQLDLPRTEGKRTKLFLSVVVPAYNEKENLPVLVEELKSVLEQSSFVRDYEILVIDDHSSDGGFELIRSLNDPKVQSIRLSRRSGSHNALRAGIATAQGDAILCISADGQDDAQVLNGMLDKLEKGFHVVWAVRKKRDEPFLSRIFAALAHRLIYFFLKPYLSEFLLLADFCLLSRKVADAINLCREYNTSLFGLILWLGFKQDYVEYDRRPRRSGKSKWSFTSRLRLLVDWITTFSGIPLKLISALGISTAILGFLYALFVFIYRLLGYGKPGWAEPVVLILVIGGTQMTMLGVLGEYLWRTLSETRKRPLYFIEERTDGG